jgi:hypothetical protein
MAFVKPGSATMNGESLWSRLGGLPLIVEGCEYDRLHATFAYEFERVTTQVRLVGAGTDGVGEDVSVFREDGTALHETRPSLPLAGEWTLAGFCDHLATLALWPEPPEWDVALRFRNWAFESAALDLALRQAGRPLHEVIGLEPMPVRFVNCSAEDIGTPLSARVVNVKPSRIGGLQRLFEVYARCARERRPMYGGGMGELGVGRGQIELLAALFHPDAPNDVAPSAYNEDDPPGHLPASPLAPRPAPTGFRWTA